MPTDADYSINDLARLTGLNVRTIRYWLAQGMLPASGESGPGAHYGQGHLDRLRLIKRLQGEYLPNAEIRRRLAPLSDAEVAGLVADPAQADPQRPTTTALEYVRGLLGGSAGSLAPQPRVEAPSPAPAAIARDSMPPTAFPARLRLATQRQVSETAAGSGPSTPAVTEPVDPDATYAAIGIAAAEPAPDTAAGTNTSPQPERSQWERLSLGPNIELHIRRPLSRPEQRRVERLITIARQVLDEERD